MTPIPILDRLEISRIESWITANADLSDHFPIKPLADRVRKAMTDNLITDEELEDLSALVSEISGDNFTKTGDVDGSIGNVFCDDIKTFSFTDKTLCFTGIFLSGTRKQCQAEVEKRGARVKSSVSSEVNVLVIGSVTSRDWRFQNFGRKIEKAMKSRSDNGFPIILSEEVWQSFLDQ